tara:strand:- start:6422 stop:7162 length:741 start_codon:yes stop_codon:yes gene_type:complete
MQKLKERLFGITVVVSLSVIFVPMLVTGNDNKLNLAQAIPQTPDVLPTNLAYGQHAHYFAGSTATHNEHDAYSEYDPEQDLHAEYFSNDEQALTPKVTAKNNKVTSNSTVKTAKKLNSKPFAAAAEHAKPSMLDNISSVKPTTAVQEQASITKEAIEQGVTEAHQKWVVRLATFGNPKNAERLAVKLKQDGYAAYTQASKRSDKDYTFVLVGANTEKQAVKKLNADLQFKYNLKGLVVEQQPDTRG